MEKRQPILDRDGRIKGIAMNDGSWDLTPEGQRFLRDSKERKGKNSVVRGLIRILCRRVK